MDLKYRQWIKKAAFDATCKETEKTIKAGDVILYLPPVKNICNGRVFCKDSKMFKENENSCHTGWLDGLNEI